MKHAWLLALPLAGLVLLALAGAFSGGLGPDLEVPPDAVVAAPEAPPRPVEEEAPPADEPVVEQPIEGPAVAPHDLGRLVDDLGRLSDLESAIRRPGSDRRAAVGAYRRALTDVADRPGALDALGALAVADLDPAAAGQAIAVASTVGGPAAVGILDRLLSGAGEPGVRLAAAEALGRSGQPAAVGSLRVAFRDSVGDPHRYRLAQLLGRAGAVEAVDELAGAATTDADPSVRVAALDAVARLDPARAFALAGVLAHDSNETVRRKAATLLDSTPTD